MLQRSFSLVVLGTAALIVSGCSATAPQEPITLTVNYPSAQQFYKLYGYAFENANPNISVQVIQDSTMDTTMAPSTDLVYLASLPDLETRIEHGELVELDSFIRQTKFDIDSLSPIVLTMLRSAGDGQLFSLAANFQSEALYYNKSLFQQYNVPVPHDQMTWEEVLLLAMRFPPETPEGAPLYGMHMNFYKNVELNYILDMGATEGLTYLNADTYQITMNTENWAKIWELAVRAFQSGAIYDKEESTDADAMLNPPFYMGRAAMTKSSFLTAYNFEPFSKYPNGQTTDWGMVTVPVDSHSPSLSRSYSIFENYGIASSSENKEAAWKLLSFIANDPTNSTYLAQAAPNRGLPANLTYMQPIAGHDLSPLIRLDPAPYTVNPYLVFPASILDAFADTTQNIVDEAIAGRLSIPQALAEVETRGQAAVDEARNKLLNE
ncbi:ABC transporter substrate-binding protein [Cohnella fermenti]|uniref:ABC transporter substrate-binding protein n=1 Tax=Cohnella fermenti TaxID=2565925 RepID=UPI001454D07C|nr:ABC transporter substrate-binding protein [Cohnella fermenti]